MTHQFECPVCEQRFAISSKSPDKKVKCPGCSRKFKLRASKKKSTSRSKPAPVPLAASAPLPTAIKLAKPIAPEVDPKPEVDQSIEETPSHVEPNKPSKAIFAAAKQKRRKRQMIRGIATVVGLALVIGILTGFLVMRLRTQNITATVDNVAVDAPIPEDSPIASSNKDQQLAAPIIASKKEAAAKPQKQIKHEELTPQKFFFHKADQVSDCWSLVHPHLVKLTVHDAFGQHKAVGTIIDSRGWILTSYSTIKGALKIEVASGYKTIDQFYQPPKLTDSVRGVITSAPEQDIAVLSINRRFIESLANIVVTEEDLVVEGEFMLQSAPPTPKNAFGYYESKISISGRFDDLAPASKALAESKSLKPDSHPDRSAPLRWLVCPDKQNALPGSPLVRIDGTLEAIHVFSENNNAHYVSVHLLKPLLASAVDQYQPLSVLRDPNDVAGATVPVGVGIDHPVRETIVQLNRMTFVCQQFNWVASNEAEYEKLGEFSEHFLKVTKYVKSNQQTAPELTRELQDQLDLIEKTISEGINNLDQASVKNMNQLAANELKQPDRVVPFFGSVAELEVSVRNDVLKLDHIEPSVHVALNPDQDRKRFNRGDVCMAFVKTPDKPLRKGISIQDQTVSAFVVDLITRIDVTK